MQQTQKFFGGKQSIESVASRASSSLFVFSSVLVPLWVSVNSVANLLQVWQEDLSTTSTQSTPPSTPQSSPSISSDTGLLSTVFLTVFALVPWLWLSLSLICAIVIALNREKQGDLESDGSEFDLDSTAYVQFNPWANVWICWISISLSVQNGKQYLISQVCEERMKVCTSSA